VSGIRGVAPETLASGRLYDFGWYVFLMLFMLPPLFGARKGGWWEDWGIAISLCIAGVALTLFLVGFIRRRRARAVHLSLERVTLELRTDSLVVRDRAAEIAIPIAEVRGVHTQIDRAKSQMRIWVSAPKHPLPSLGFSPLLILTGDLANQRAIKAEFERIVP